MSQVAQPVYTPDGGTSASAYPVSVSIGTTEGANMRWTVDGTTPTETYGNLVGNYLASISVTPTNAGTTLKTIAFKDGWITSPVKSATYYTSATPSPTPTATPTGTPFCRSCFPPPPCDCGTVEGGLDTNMASFSNSLSSDGMTEDSATTSNGPAPIAVYLYAGDQIVENVTTGYLYFRDSLGNTSHVTDSAGNLLERYTYTAFGKPYFYDAGGTLRITSYDPAGNPITTSAYGIRHLFQGQLWTQETGLNDYRNRVELPTMGVFLQPDPIGFKGDAANLYRFCNNNAVNRTDPTGLVTRDWRAAMRAIDQGGLIEFFQAEAYSQGLTMARVSAIRRTKGEACTLPQYSDWRDAADSWREKTMSLVKRDNIEDGGEMAQKNDDPKISIATSPHPGPGVGPVDDGIQKGSFQKFTPNEARVPRGYHMTGFYYGHTHHDPRFFHYDAMRAQAAGLNAVLFLPARRDAMSQEPTSLYYDHRTKPPE